MPHCELVGPCDLARFHLRFQPRSIRESGQILKVNDAFLSTGGHSLLLDCIVIEGGLRQSFLVVATTHPAGVMVRLWPRIAPEQTPGVKRCLAWVTLWLQASWPGTAVGKTNLREQMAAPLPPAAVQP